MRLPSSCRASTRRVAASTLHSRLRVIEAGPLTEADGDRPVSHRTGDRLYRAEGARRGGSSGSNQKTWLRPRRRRPRGGDQEGPAKTAKRLRQQAPAKKAPAKKAPARRRPRRRRAKKGAEEGAAKKARAQARAPKKAPTEGTGKKAPTQKAPAKEGTRQKTRAEVRHRRRPLPSGAPSATTVAGPRPATGAVTVPDRYSPHGRWPSSPRTGREFVPRTEVTRTSRCRSCRAPRSACSANGAGKSTLLPHHGGVGTATPARPPDAGYVEHRAETQLDPDKDVLSNVDGVRDGRCASTTS